MVVLGDPAMPGLGMCREHTIRALEDRKRGAARRIYHDTLKGWVRNTKPANAVTAAMRRTGALKWKVKHVEPYGWRRCVAKAKSTGKQCRRWAEHHLGRKTCKFHGGRGKGPWNSWKRGDPRLVPIARKRAVKEEAREKAKFARDLRAQRGMLPLSTGFRVERPQPKSMYDQFLEGGRGPPRKRDSWSPY
jgi:hypothetical protein